MIKKIFYLILLIFFLIPVAAIAQGGGEPGPIITIDNLINALTPLIILGVTWIVQKVKPTLMGWNIVWVVIPILNLIATAILVLIDQASSFLAQFIWNFLAIAVAQLIIQLSSDKREQNRLAKQKALLDKKQH